MLACHNCYKCLTGSKEEEEKLIFTGGFGGHCASSAVPTALRPVAGVNNLDMKEHEAEENSALSPSGVQHERVRGSAPNGCLKAMH